MRNSARQRRPLRPLTMLRARLRLRDATTMLEMTVVGVLLMGLIGTITAFGTYMPRWFGRTGNRIDIVREQNVTAAFIQKEMNSARHCSCPGTEELRIDSATTGTQWTYSLAQDPQVPDRFELRRSEDGVNYVRVTGLLSGFTCTERPEYNGVDLCIVWEKDGSYRRSTVQWRRATQRVMEVQMADLDRDGVNDVVTARPQQAVVPIYTGTRTGTFNVTTSAALNSGSEPRSIAIGDYDRNGKLDLAVLTAQDIQVLEAAPSLTANPRHAGICSYNVTSTIDLGIGASPTTLVAGDLDRDGKLDLVAADAGCHDVTVHYGRGHLRFDAAVRWPIAPRVLPGEPRRIKLADMNRDGILDLVIGLANPTGGKCLAIATGTGLAATMFNDAVAYAAGRESWDFSIGDLDRNAVPDVVSADWQNDRLALMLGQTTGALLGAPGFTRSVSPTAVGFMQYDSDQIPDLAVIKRVRGTECELDVLPGTTSPGFGTTLATTPFPTGAVPDELDGISVVTGNVTRDTRDDWVGAYMTPDPGGIRNENAPYVAHLGTLPSASETWASFSGVGTGGSTAVLSGDFDRDGYPDIASARSGSAVLDIFLHNGSATPPFYTDPASSSPTTGGSNVGVAMADFSRDGILDLVTLQAAKVSFHRGGASGTFANGTTSNPDPSSAAVATGDFNRDGFPDIVVAGTQFAAMKFTAGAAAPFSYFSATRYPTAAGPAASAVSVADMNMDGNLDVVVATTGGVSVWFGRGNGEFQTTPPTALAMGIAPASLDVGDLDNDGLLDIVTANEGGNSVSVRYGRPNFTWGGLAADATISCSTLINGINSPGPRAVKIVDLDRDGILDLVIGGYTTAPLIVELVVPAISRYGFVHGSGLRTWPLQFTGYADTNGKTKPGSVCILDANRDGKPDLVFPNSAIPGAQLRLGN